MLCACTNISVPEGRPAENWRLVGKLGVRSPDYNGSVTMDWQHSVDHFEISLTGALGVSVAEIEGDQSLVHITLGDEPTRTLPLHGVYDQTGYELPLVHMIYWVRGVPNPAYVSIEHETGFYQAGWRVEYQVFEALMPRKIRFTRDTTKLTLIIRTWEF
jgi:outer membrane lipoprotein LolB